jgi:serine/threonine-protein kinase
MTLPSGTRIGVYEVLAPLGAGGMGEVYRARDTRLDRDVALKILPEAFAADTDRVARFEREAKMLAALNHPHIAQIHGLEQSGSTSALVMELVEGEDLAQRIARGPIPIDEAMPIVRQITEALEAAHEQGIIHRDLKPANVKVRPDGTVKVLDFGLAKAFDPTASHIQSVATSPTITSPMTIHGVILGTAAYMSPEQARGRRVDRRTDVWAFGVLLFEMLAGRRPFEGEDAAEVIGAAIHKEPDWTALPSSITPAITAVLKCCLEKDPGRRMRDMGDVRLALSGAFESQAHAIDDRAIPAGRSPWRAVAIAAAVALTASAATGTATWMALRPDPPRLTRFAITPPAAAVADVVGFNPDRSIAISPDGSQIAYIGNNGTQVFRWPLDQLEPVPIITGTPRGPLFSPDSQWVAFFDGSELKRVAIAGGAPATICKVSNNNRGGTWSGDTIVFATADPDSGLWSVPAAGGEPRMLTKPDHQRGEMDHVFPSFLPGGTSVLFTILPSIGSGKEPSVAVLDLKTGTSKAVLNRARQAVYSRTGHLVYGTEPSLQVAAFDLATSSVSGAPVPLPWEVHSLSATSRFAFDIAGNGTMVYMPTSPVVEEPRSLAWIDRTGKIEPLRAPQRGYQKARLSPDGTRVAAEVFEGRDRGIWTMDIARGTLSRVTFAPTMYYDPVWNADGKRIFFRTGAGPNKDLFWQAADGTGVPEKLTEAGRDIGSPSVSRDGQFVLFALFKNVSGNMEGDLGSMRVGVPSRPEMLLTTPADERGVTISPDGKSIAYTARDKSAGDFQVFVRPYPDVNSGRVQISTTNGRMPSWSRNGRELFYVSTDIQSAALMSVPVQTTGGAWSAGTPVKLFESPTLLGPSDDRTYDASPDGQRFLVISAPARPATAAAPQRFVVVQNWVEELKRISAVR